jgi:tetratricopeptide (TPR) repeat protein
LFSHVWPPAPSHFSHYLIALVASVAGWQARTPVTIITPFQIPKVDVPFSGEIVADALRDGLKSIYDDVEKENNDQRLKPADMDLPALRDLNSTKFSTGQDPAGFAVEVQGLSYERMVSAARVMFHRETLISGDVVLNAAGNELTLIARSSESSWRSIPSSVTAEGLRRASRDLAEKILEEQDPTLAGSALLKDGQIDKAVAALERAQKLKPNDVNAKLNLCMGYEASHRYSDAMNCYDHIAKNMKPGPPAEISEHLAHAQYLYGKDGNREKAIDAFRKLAEIGRNSSRLELAKALEDTDRHKDAVETYNDFLANTGKDNKHDLAIGHVNLGAAYANQKDHKGALDEYVKALESAPGDVLVLINLAVETAETGDVDVGIAQLESVMEENANSESMAFAYMQLGNLLRAKKHDWRSAAEQYRKATELRPNYDEAHRRLAVCLVHEGFSGYALSEYTKVAKLSALEAERRYAPVVANKWLGDTLREQHRYSSAVSAYGEAVRLKHDYRAAHYELGLLRERQGHPDQAVHEYRAAALPNPKELDDGETVRVAQLRLGEALASQRAHRQEGIDELSRLMKLDLKNLECHLCLAKAFLEEGKFVEAGDQYQSAFELDPKSAAAHYGRAFALHKQGLVDQAVVEYRQAAKLEPDNAVYHANLARELKLQHLNQEAAAESKIVAELEAIPPRASAEGQHLRCQDVR